MLRTNVLFIAVLCFLMGACSDNESKKHTNKLTVWSTESDKIAEAVLADVEKQFEAMHPDTDLEIEIVSWGSVSERLINASRGDQQPDISHIQPFMAYSLYSKDQLLPITDVRAELEQEYGKILPAVRDLQVFGPESEVYGLAYAVGTTFWSVRADMMPEGLDLNSIKTWADYIEFAKQLKQENPGQGAVTLPGGSPFFMDQLYAELVANNGGRLFDENKCPVLTNPASISALEFFLELKESGVLAPEWASQGYTDQFVKLGSMKVSSVPVTYARASNSVKALFEEDPKRNAEDANDDLILWLDQPTKQTGQQSLATIDAEPWVVFAEARNRVQASGKTNEELAKDFLRLFYSKKNYSKYTQAVPVHLTPIFETMAEDSAYVESTKPFQKWHDYTLAKLKAGTTRPILMPDNSAIGRSLPFLLEFQRAGILSGAIADVLQTEKTPTEAAQRAQLRATQLVSRSSNISCEN